MMSLRLLDDKNRPLDSELVPLVAEFQPNGQQPNEPKGEKMRARSNFGSILEIFRGE